jgi:plastocyanin
MAKQGETMPTFRGCALVLALVLVPTVTLGACGSSDKKSPATATTSASSASTGSAGTSAGTSTSAAAGSQTITIQSFKFNPDPLPTKAGKVTVVNMDEGTPHSVTADDNSFDTGIFTKNDGPKTITLSKSGTFKYHCQVHNFMHGTIQVS